MLSVFVLMISEDFTLIQIIFEVGSAFGSVGLSLGITSQLSEFGKAVIIMLLMFIGRVGITALLFFMVKKIETETFHYPKERIIIGVIRKREAFNRAHSSFVRMSPILYIA